jgi:hypothetical protein
MLRRLGCMLLVGGLAPSARPAPQAGPACFFASAGAWTLPATSMGADFFSRCASGMRRPPAASATVSACAASSPTPELDARPRGCALKPTCGPGTVPF